MSLPFSKGKIKVFVSSVSLDKEIKLRQQRIIQCLEAREIKHVVADLATNASDKRELRVLMMGKPGPPPQIFNGNDYCGDYAAFCLALEDEILDEFLKLKDPKKPTKDNQESSSTKPSEAKNHEETGTEGKPETDNETENVQSTVRNLDQTAVIDKEKVTSDNKDDKTPISEAVISDNERDDESDDESDDEDEDENESKNESERSDKLPSVGKSQEPDSSTAGRTHDSLDGDKKTIVSPVKTQSTPVPPPPPPPPPPPLLPPPPPPLLPSPPSKPPLLPPATSAPPLKTSDIKPPGDAHQMPQSLLADIRSSTKLKLKPTPKPATKLPGTSKDSVRASTAPTKAAIGDGKPKFSADELFKGRMALKSKYDRSIPKTANLASVKGGTSDSKKATPFGDKVSSAGKNLPGDFRKPEALLASVLKAPRNKK